MCSLTFKSIAFLTPTIWSVFIISISTASMTKGPEAWYCFCIINIIINLVRRFNVIKATVMMLQVCKPEESCCTSWFQLLWRFDTEMKSANTVSQERVKCVFDRWLRARECIQYVQARVLLLLLKSWLFYKKTDSGNTFICTSTLSVLLDIIKIFKH